MQSKTSSFKLFDKTVFLKNLKKLWPVWACYTFFIMWLIPGVISINSHGYYTSEPKNINLQKEIYINEMNIAIAIALIASIIIAVSIFAYLEKENSCSFFHSLPLTRESLYSTNMLTGLIFMYIPNILAIVTSLILLGKYEGVPKALLALLLMLTLEELYFYSFAVLCMIIIGHIVTAPIIYGICMFIVNLFVDLINSFISSFYFGVSDYSIEKPHGILSVLSPIDIFEEADFYSIVENDKVVGFESRNLLFTVLLSLITTIVIIAISVICYRIRKSEAAGDVVAIGFIRPVFRWVFGIGIGFILSYAITDSFKPYSNYDDFYTVVFVILFIVLTNCAYLGAQMILKKNFNIFGSVKIEWPIFAVVSTVLVISVTLFGQKVERNLPDAKDVECVELYMYNTDACIITDAELINRLIETNRELIENKDTLTNNYYEGSCNLDIQYFGEKYLHKNYRIPMSVLQEGGLLYQFTEDNLEYLYMNVFEGGYNFSSSFSTGYGNDMKNVTLDEKETLELLEAYRKDIREKNIHMVNEYVYTEPNSKEEFFDIVVNFDNKRLNQYMGESVIYDEIYGLKTNQYQRFLSVTSQCRNTAQFLLEHIDF